MEFYKIWIEQCEAARGIEAEFGTDKALSYLIDEKFINFLEVAETNRDFRNEIPAFVAEIRKIFEPWQLAECLESARERPPFDAADYEDDDSVDAEDIEMDRQSDIQGDLAAARDHYSDQLRCGRGAEYAGVGADAAEPDLTG